MDIDILHILHFNDVYNVEEQKQEPVAGAARFTTALKQHGAGQDSIVLFSGDCLSPSYISNATHGRHIPSIMNKMFINCSLFGNHEFDYGMDIFQECINQCNFPWINSNVYDKESNELLGTQLPYQIMIHNDLKIGIIGLIEKEWIEVIPCFTLSNINVKDMIETGRQLGQYLKIQQKCHLVIALTHMRWPNDRLLAKNVPEIDLILGGHDHEYQYEWIKLDENLLLDRNKISIQRLVIKSGSDYQTFSHLRVKYDKENCKLLDIDIEQVLVDSHWEPDNEVQKLVIKSTKKLEKKLDTPLGLIEVDFDVRSNSIRLKESNIGNFICDIVLTAVEANCVLINAGTLRGDRIFKAGLFTLRDLTTILPYLDKLSVIEITGSQLIEVLENSLSEYPKAEGRFPMIGGMRFVFNPLKPVGTRVIVEESTIQNEPINMKQKYRLCTTKYLHAGNDGYRIFPECPLLLDDEKCPILLILVQNYFRTVQVLKGFKQSRTCHRQCLIPFMERQKLMQQSNSNNCNQHLLDNSNVKDTTSRWITARCALIEQREKLIAYQIAPQVDGRIKMITA
ncbi:unnamed protein product [Schistosoma rodhaini]|uniref:5'-nucleotidase n=1 Tax=Schistosoma rodhaini TaxID=6188 RepID=A0AA85GG16_9TREM|nr:unnamed protein product [Schistosoma rodhaini]